MGFFSYNEAWYRSTLKTLEGSPRTPERVYAAKQSLKLLDDLVDEGYTELNSLLEERFACLTRLRAYLRSAGETPFPVGGGGSAPAAYAAEEYELGALTDALVRASASALPSDKPFLRSLRDYAAFLPCESGTACIFLFRDTLLLYACFAARGREKLFPWLLNRRFLAESTGTEDFDDALRAPIYTALESGCGSFEAFSECYSAVVQPVWDSQPALKAALHSMLEGIDAEKILVVESGYCGTFPMALRSLDSRVDFRMYTTAPYLYELYAGKIFCRRYEDIRAFETLESQDALLQYADFRDGHFYVRMNRDEKLRERALGEIRILTER